MSRVDISDIKGETLLKLIKKTGEVTAEAINDTNTKVEANTEAINDTNTKVEANTEAINNLAIELNETTETATNAYSTAITNSSSITELQSMDASLQEQISSNDTDISTIQSDYTTLNNSLTIAKSDISEQSGQILTLYNTTQNLSSTVSDNCDSIDSLEEQVSNIGITRNGNTLTVNGTSTDIISTTVNSGFDYNTGTFTVNLNGAVSFSCTIYTTARSGWGSTDELSSLIGYVKEDDLIWLTGTFGDYDVNVGVDAPDITSGYYSNNAFIESNENFHACRVSKRVSSYVGGGYIGGIVADGPILLTLYSTPHDSTTEEVATIYLYSICISFNNRIIGKALTVGDNGYLTPKAIEFDDYELTFYYERR